MILIRIVAVAVVALMVSGCSWLYGEKGLIKDKKYDYTASKMEEPLKTPEGLNPIREIDEFFIPAIDPAVADGALGKEMSNLPPILILATGEKMGVDNESNASLPTVWFRYNEIEFWQGLQDYLESKKIKIAKKDLLNGTIETEWIEVDNSTYYRYLFGSKKPIGVRNRYLFQISENSRGREKLLSVTHVARELKQKSRSDWEPVVVSNKQASLFLNGFLGYWSEVEEKAATERVKRANLGIRLALDNDANGDVVFLSHAEFQDTWSKLAKTLPKLGFTINDRDQSLGIYYGTYKATTSSKGVLAYLFGSGKKNKLGLDEVKYLFNLSAVGDKTAISITEKDGTKLTSETMTRIYPYFSDRFSSKSKNR